MNDQHDVSSEVRAAIEETVGQEMDTFGLRAATVATSEDHDGDPILLVETEYDPDGIPIDPEVVASLGTKLRERLWGMGETRFPHIRHHFPERRKIAGYR